jgi:hypothetical protein
LDFCFYFEDAFEVNPESTSPKNEKSFGLGQNDSVEQAAKKNF